MYDLHMYKMYVQMCAVHYDDVDVKVFHNACIIFYSCKSSLYFTLVF